MLFEQPLHQSPPLLSLGVYQPVELARQLQLAQLHVEALDFQPRTAYKQQPVAGVGLDLRVVEAGDRQNARGMYAFPPLDNQATPPPAAFLSIKTHLSEIFYSERVGFYVFKELNFAVHGRSFAFGRVFGNYKHLDAHRTRACAEFDYIALLHAVGRTRRPAVDQYPLVVAGLVGHSAALYKPGHLKVFVKPHSLFRNFVLRALPALKTGMVCSGRLMVFFGAGVAGDAGFAHFGFEGAESDERYLIAEANGFDGVKTAEMALSESFLDSPVLAATASVNPALFIVLLSLILVFYMPCIVITRSVQGLKQSDPRRRLKPPRGLCLSCRRGAQCTKRIPIFKGLVDILKLGQVGRGGVKVKPGAFCAVERLSARMSAGRLLATALTGASGEVSFFSLFFISSQLERTSLALPFKLEVAEDMGVTGNQLAADAVDDVGYVKLAGLGGHLSVENNLQQHVAQFFAQ